MIKSEALTFKRSKKKKICVCVLAPSERAGIWNEKRATLGTQRHPGRLVQNCKTGDVGEVKEDEEEKEEEEEEEGVGWGWGVKVKRKIKLQHRNMTLAQRGCTAERRILHSQLCYRAILQTD